MKTVAALTRNIFLCAIAIIMLNAAGFPVFSDSVFSMGPLPQETNTESAESPVWFNAEQEYDGDTNMAFVKTANAYLTRVEAELALESAVKRIADNVAEQRLQLNDCESLRLSGNQVLSDFVFEDRLVFSEKLAVRATPEGGGKELKFFSGFAQLHFGDGFDVHLRQKMVDYQTKLRLLQTALTGGAILALLTISFCYFRMEIATRGFYSRRLQTVSFVMAAIVVAIAYLLSQQIS